jgi:septum formation inhibitor-activating ATPase MinD
MGKVIVVTSGKGGVGKTTSTAALGAALARAGNNVVVVDFDVGLRNLDLVMGAESRVVFDLINVLHGTANLPQALIRDKRLETLYLLPASQSGDKDALTEVGVARGDPARAARGEMLNIEDVLEILSVPLLGIIPESEEVLRASNLGAPITICGRQSAPSRAYFDAARRLAGEAVEMTIPTDKEGLFTKLWGRRAA